MELEAFEEKLSGLENNSVSVERQNTQEEFFQMLITFSQSARLQTEYWRIIKNGRHYLSSFDHRQVYGLTAPIDALEKAREELGGKTVLCAKFDRETGDLIFEFADLKLQILNFTGYEIWEINFPDGSSEISNYAKEYWNH